MKKLVLITISLGIILVAVSNSLADVPTNNSIEQIKNLYESNAHNWSSLLTGYAVRIFWILALIDLAWLGIQQAMQLSEFNSFIANLVSRIIGIGFFWVLLQPVGGDSRGLGWAKDIINSLIQAGGAANSSAGGNANISPGGVFDTGYNLAAQIFNAGSMWEPGDTMALYLGGIIIMVCFALIAAMMLLIYVQSYITIYAGVILLGFGGSIFTKDISLMYFRHALSVGVKLFVMILIVGLGQQLMTAWTSIFNVTFEQVVLFIGSSIVLLALVKSIPDMVGDLINGFSWGTGQGLMAAGAQTASVTGGAVAKTASALTGAAAAAAGGYMAVKAASKVGQYSNIPTSQVLKQGIKDYTKAVLSGEASRHHGTTGGNIARQILERNGLNKNDINVNKGDEQKTGKNSVSSDRS